MQLLRKLVVTIEIELASDSHEIWYYLSYTNDCRCLLFCWWEI